MQNKLAALDRVLLMGPGPSPVADNVYAAMSTPLVGHMDTDFIALMDTIKEQLQTVFQTSHTVTMPMSGTGSAGMETAFVNMVEPGDPVLILQNGVFGKRMVDVATRLGADVTELDFKWGTPVIPAKVSEALTSKKYNLVAVVHAETSTGVENPVNEIGHIVKAHGALYLVDCVTSLGGIPVKLDDWGVDICYSGTQKCLSCPPGLSPVSFSEAAMKKLGRRKTKVPNWYLDLSMITSYWEGHSRVYHHTAPISMNYALYQALANLLDEGLTNAFARHRAMHEKLLAGLDKLGFKPFVDAACRLPMVNLVTCPDGVDEAELRSRLRTEHHIEIGGGLGVLAGKVLRIGVMGEGAHPENIDRLLYAMEACIR